MRTGEAGFLPQAPPPAPPQPVDPGPDRQGRRCGHKKRNEPNHRRISAQVGPFVPAVLPTADEFDRIIAGAKDDYSFLKKK
ncbi:MAG: hypothetical protein KIT09_32790 [Bryobacteraceae bacterium]|nr:hypothetical protein [Bryobacteraceae bacterium]